jgi:hypothetical protein
MKILAFEGLVSYWPAAFVRRGLLEPLKVFYPMMKYQVYPWWFPVFLPEEPVILVGHSFGGSRAISIARPGDILVTLDPRSMFTTRFEAPALVAFNFYRKGRMPGYEVAKAINVRLPDSVAHTEVPRQKEVFECLERLVGR